ncbi:DUF192 domain-containing protein [Pseudovibrio sp. Tun.PSC04-5.I4]|uniref:DUF192 domain-containing protein n=1 Tax=Pseudovibrio sp. Tun.PSC04-5.I4 TaxID=1798213 RepID=UPI000885983B|nr:DUF192 domain-containing protein [Pseudovibrio sp. Tun.PSC04-5.I4]SDR04234.1 hypothetical protein SAMN04515695_2463 [Pseudovibrio sp. Tun.PSC04-5.I4]
MAVLKWAVIAAMFCLSSAFAAELRTETIEVRSATGKHEFQVEVAENAAARAQGLMGRTDLSPDQGMLFVFSFSVPQNFWMKNTPSALDIIFIGSDNIIKSIAKNTVPYSEEIISSGVPAQYVLEVLAGRTMALGIKPGDRVIRIP